MKPVYNLPLDLDDAPKVIRERHRSERNLARLLWDQQEAPTPELAELVARATLALCVARALEGMLTVDGIILGLAVFVSSTLVDTAGGFENLVDSPAITHWEVIDHPTIFARVEIDTQDEISI